MSEKTAYISTPNELIEALKNSPAPLSTFLVITDDNNDEYYIKDISLTMGGQYHAVIELEKVTDPHKKWFRTKEIYLEELKNKIDCHESDKFKKEWADCHNGDISKLLKIIDNEKNYYESIDKNYKEGEIID